jgi:hypothetical protein
MFDIRVCVRRQFDLAGLTVQKYLVTFLDVFTGWHLNGKN